MDLFAKEFFIMHLYDGNCRDMKKRLYDGRKCERKVQDLLYERDQSLNALRPFLTVSI